MPLNDSVRRTPCTHHSIRPYTIFFWKVIMGAPTPSSASKKERVVVFPEPHNAASKLPGIVMTACTSTDDMEAIPALQVYILRTGMAEISHTEY